MRYILNNEGYLFDVSFGAEIACDLGECTEYTGGVPEGYSTIEQWHEKEYEKINAWKILDGNLVFDENKYNELQIKWQTEEEENSCATQKYVNDKLKSSTAVVTDELAAETTGNSLIILNDAGSYDIPYLKVESETVKNVKVVSSNKNILGIENVRTTINGVEITINEDGTITLDGTATENIKYNLNGSDTNKEMMFLIKNSIDYVISGLTDNVSLSLYSHNGLDRTLVGTYGNQLINVSSTYNITQTTLNITSGATFKDVIISPQIEINNNATEFIKHEETKSNGTLKNNECIIESLNSYQDRTIIMIDNEVDSIIRYYRYKYINEKLVEIEVQGDEVRTTLTEVNNTIDGQNQKIAEITQTVNELNSKISDVADITTSKESLNGAVFVEKVNESEPIYIRIHPTDVSISCLYPRNDLYPSDDLFMPSRTIRFTNTETNEDIDYELPTDLLYYDAENYDEFILDYDTQSCTVNKRVVYDEQGNTTILGTPETIEYSYPKIPLTEGSYEVKLLGYDTGYIFVRLMIQNIYTTQFATKAEVSSEISQTSQEINLSVDKKLTLYPTTTEMNSAINISAEGITSSVSQSYATKTELANTKSEIKQTTDSITSTVSKKIGNDEVCSVISQSSDEINITSNRLAITSDNFTLTKNGAITCKSAKVTGGTISGTTISLTDGSKSNPKFKVSNDNSTTSILPDRIYMSGKDDGLYINNSSNSDSRAYIYADTQGGGITLGGNASNDITLRGGSSPSITCNGKMYADAYNYNSLESMKKNIEQFDDNVLDVVKNSELYRFNYNREKDTDKKHIGFVIGENYKTPREIISQDESGIDSYTMISVLWKAFQEYIEKTDIKIEELQKQIKEMKGE